MRKPVAIVAALVLILAGACSSGDDGGGGGTAKGRTLQIGVDAAAEGFGASWTHFFPHEVKAHPGDTLEFISHFTGEPHSVAFGTLVNEAIAAFAKLDPNHQGDPPPEIKAVLDKVPFVFSDEGGPEDLFVQAASQPCYLQTAEPPTREACPKAQRKPPATIDGKERFLSTGFLPDQAKASFTLSEKMAPGDYTFMCLVHGPEMTEKVTVVPKDSTIPGPAEVEAEGHHHLMEFLDTVKADVDKVRASTAPQAVAGVFAKDDTLPSAGINVLPEEIDVKAGEKVTWEVNGFHTISFNAPEDARPWLQFDDSGVLVTNEKSFTPAASPDIPETPPVTGTGNAAPPKVPIDAGAWDGQGFHSSGAPFSDAQMIYSLAFSTPGTYKYVCLVHPDMEGTVKVT